MNHSSGNTSFNTPTITDSLQDIDEDYSVILRSHGLEPKLVEYYWQIGKSTQAQGWILHISAVISQVEEVLQTVIPFLAAQQVPFKIPMDKEAYRNLVHGFLGIAQIGKLISIYPQTDAQAVYLAQQLIQLTTRFKGPAIPTDISLSNIVYTRYGSFQSTKSVGASGKEEKYISDQAGNLVADEYYVPARLPKGLPWPFGVIKAPVIPSQKRILNNFYKPLTLLKEDARGNVFKGLFMKGLFRVSPCVIKQGCKGMSSENTGRDISDRLRWQQILHERLQGKVPLPKLIAYFEEDGDAYLVIEYIKGESLLDRLKRINFNVQPACYLAVSNLMQVLDYLFEILRIIKIFHDEGFVHRDIAPGNFMIDENNKVFLIDIELAYSLKENYPDPPFSLGTYGFMSPQQEAVQTPTIQEDIYALGALMMLMFTGLSPVKFDVSNIGQLSKNLEHFINEPEIIQLIISCLSYDPISRPDMMYIQSVIKSYKNKIQSYPQIDKGISAIPNTTREQLDKTIREALAGLTQPPIIQLNEVWYSHTKQNGNFETPIQKEFSRYPGLSAGLGGALYLLARAYKLKFSVDNCFTSYNKGWDFINDYNLNRSNELSPGLFTGTAGMALSFKEGLISGLLVDHDKVKMTNWLSTPNASMDVANGISGQGIALLQCQGYLDEYFIESKLNHIIQTILIHQKKNGSWILEENDLSFAYGVPGITWFLLTYYGRYQNNNIKQAALKALGYLLKRTNNIQDLLEKGTFRNKTLKGNEIGDERTGIILTLLKAYATLKTIEYKTLVEKALYSYPSFMVNNNFTQENGLAGLGELYLEAWSIFHDEIWKKRADWICQVFMHTFLKSTDSTGYWKMEETNDPTADFLVGNTGIIHFLLRCYAPDQINYRILY